MINLILRPKLIMSNLEMGFAVLHRRMIDFKLSCVLRRMVDLYNN